MRAARRQGMLGAMGNPYGITLDEASLRWAAAEGVPESVIAAVCLLDEKSVDEIVAKLSPVELEQVIKIVGRSPRGYAPGAYDALKGERHRRSTEPPAQRLSPKAAAKEQAGRVREDTDRLRGGHTRRPMGLSADGRQSAAERGADALKGKRNLASLQPPSERLSPNVALKPGQPAHTNSGAERSRRIHVRRFTAPRLEVPQTSTERSAATTIAVAASAGRRAKCPAPCPPRGAGILRSGDTGSRPEGSNTRPALMLPSVRLSGGHGRTAGFPIGGPLAGEEVVLALTNSHTRLMESSKGCDSLIPNASHMPSSAKTILTLAEVRL